MNIITDLWFLGPYHLFSCLLFFLRYVCLCDFCLLVGGVGAEEKLKDLLSNLYTVSSESMHPWKMTTGSLMDGVAKNRTPFPVQQQNLFLQMTGLYHFLHSHKDFIQQMVALNCDIKNVPTYSSFQSTHIPECKYSLHSGTYYPHCYFTMLNHKKKGPAQFCHLVLLEIHRTLEQK